jgi:hypothetical protein
MNISVIILIPKLRGILTVFQKSWKINANLNAIVCCYFIYGCFPSFMSCEFMVVNLECTCPKVECSRHGKCCECVAYHRNEKKNIPVCMRNLIN